MAEILRRDQIFDGHQDRTIVEFRLKTSVRFRPVRRGPEVDGFVDGERIEADQHQPRDQPEARDRKSFRRSDHSGQPTPQGSIEREHSLKGKEIEGQSPAADPIGNGGLHRHVEIDKHADPRSTG